MKANNGLCRHSKTNDPRLTVCLKHGVTNVQCEAHCMSSKYCIGYNYVTSLKKCMLIPSVQSCIRDFTLRDGNLASSRDDLEPYVASEMYRCSIKKECKINKKSIKNFIFHKL